MGEVTILGGRAHRLLPHIIPLIGKWYHQGEVCLLLVPEQYTLQAEVELIRRLELPGFFNIQVLSPSRLTQRIFDAAGSDGRTPLDSRGKRMALSRAIDAVKKELTYYRRAAHQQGLTEKMASLIADFKRGRLNAEGLLETAAQLPNQALSQKLSDIARCWQEYEKQLEGRFVDGEDVQEEAAKRLPQSGLFAGAHVFIYGFDVLSPQFCRMLCAGAGICRDMTAALTMDRPYARDGSLFVPVRQSAQRFVKMLKAENIPVKWEYLPFEPLKSAKEIAHLEENLYAYPARPYQGPVEAISLRAAPNPYAEAHEAAAEMIRLHEDGIAWGEMAVAAGSLPAYASILSAVLTSYRIPFYLEEKAPASSHGLIRFVLHAIRAASKGYSRADVLACLKSGYAPIDPIDCFRLENYALAYGIYGERWRKPFTRGDQAEAAQLEPMRHALIAPLTELQAGLREAKTAADSLRAVFQLLERVDAYETLRKEEERLLELAMPAQAAQARQVWQFLLGTLDQMNDLLAGAGVPATQMAAWLEAGFSAGELSALPPTPDTVVCGEIGHVMPGEIKVLFAMGLGDGMMQSDSGSLLRDEERALLEEKAETYLGLSGEGRDALSRTDLWRTLALPTQRLYLSHAQATQNGQSQRPAGFLSMLRGRLFPQLHEAGGVTGLTGAPEPLAPGPALDALALRLSSLWDGASLENALPPEWLDAWACLYAGKETRGRVEAITQALTGRLHAAPLRPATARKLFGHETMSVSRLEEYAQCPYKHFVHYGLKPVPRREWRLDAAQVGTFFHDAMRAFTEKAASHSAWPQVTREDCDGLMDEVLAPVTKEWEQGPLGENAQTKALGRRYLRIIRRAAWTFTQHAMDSGFSPKLSEVAFGYPGGLLPPIALTMPDGAQVLLRGVIDRVDLYEGEEGVYLRVVDYKSGVRELDPVQMWHGLQLQLLLYLLAALNVAPGAEPAGAFYFHIDDPLANVETDAKELAEKEIAKLLRLSGVVLSDVQVVRAMDPNGLSMPKVLKQDGTPAATAPALDLSQMRALLYHAQTAAQKLAAAMREGGIGIAPARGKDFDSCQYCEYAGVCRWDARLPGARPRFLKPLSLAELKQRLGALAGGE